MELEFAINSTNIKTVIDLAGNIHNINSLNHNYTVYYNNYNLDQLINENYDINDYIFIDKNVYKLIIKSSIFIDKPVFIYNAIEDNKNIENVLQLIDALYNIKFNKTNKLIVIGGGITQDVGGFASAIYKRGINWIYIPTTLLSMTDSCIGGKVNVNRNSKNMIGMFNAPNKIIISDFFLKSLNIDDINSGLGEALKLSLIGGIKAFDCFKEHLLEKDYINIIKLSSIIKKQIIEIDEFDNNERKVLNYGHSIGHAIESTSNYYIPHGIAVLMGMYIKNILFYNNKYDDINDIILSMIDPKFYKIQFDYQRFISHLLDDKKNKGDNICFILLEDIGKSIISFIQLNDINKNLEIVISRLFNS